MHEGNLVQLYAALEQRKLWCAVLGLNLLGTEGTAATSVRAVCARAGLSSRYFYESFTDLDELLVGVFDELMSRTLDRVIAVLIEPSPTIERAVEAVAAAFVTITRNDPRAMRVAFIEAWNSESVMRRRVQHLHRGAQLLSATVCALAGIDDDRRVGVDVAAFVVVGGLLEAILGWIDGSLDTDADALVGHFTPAAVAALESATRNAKAAAE